MLGSLAALAALATVGEVSYQTVCAHFVSGYDILSFHVCPVVIGHMTEQCFLREGDGRADTGMGKHLGENKAA